VQHMRQNIRAVGFSPCAQGLRQTISKHLAVLGTFTFPVVRLSTSLQMRRSRSGTRLHVSAICRDSIAAALNAACSPSINDGGQVFK